MGKIYILKILVTQIRDWYSRNDDRCHLYPTFVYLDLNYASHHIVLINHNSMTYTHKHLCFTVYDLINFWYRHSRKNDIRNETVWCHINAYFIGISKHQLHLYFDVDLRIKEEYARIFIRVFEKCSLWKYWLNRAVGVAS